MDWATDIALSTSSQVARISASVFLSCLPLENGYTIDSAVWMSLSAWSMRSSTSLICSSISGLAESSCSFNTFALASCSSLAFSSAAFLIVARAFIRAVSASFFFATNFAFTSLCSVAIVGIVADAALSSAPFLALNAKVAFVKFVNSAWSSSTNFPIASRSELLSCSTNSAVLVSKASQVPFNSFNSSFGLWAFSSSFLR
mmetsp:Transcript_64925/g.101269  ORF Transcript_64925/g.101269 Transcript_64925/m.101269 type:complete len:201 (+) Transcript_64925:1630-2232(+)